MRQQPSTHAKTFQERLANKAQHHRDEAAKLPEGTARDLLLRRAKQTDTASEMDAWLISPGLQSPK